MRKHEKWIGLIIFLCMLLLFTNCSCITLELGFSNHKKSKNNPKMELKKKKTELREKIGLLQEGLRNDWYSSHQERQGIEQIAEKLKQELRQVLETEHTINIKEKKRKNQSDYSKDKR